MLNHKYDISLVGESIFFYSYQFSFSFKYVYAFGNTLKKVVQMSRFKINLS